MKTYTVLYAEEVPHYATVEIEADNDQDATERAKAHDFGDAPLEADRNNAVSRRIVHIEDVAGNTPGHNISLDNTLLLCGSEARDAIRYALECLGNFKADWLANHGLTVLVERLELAYAEAGGAP
jgi:hypothetical protein